MWWKKDKKQEKETDVEMLWERQMREAKEFRDVGEPFKHVGIAMIVTGHRRIKEGGGSLYIESGIAADYGDKNGVIRSVWFEWKELPVLRTQNPGD